MRQIKENSRKKEFQKTGNMPIEMQDVSPFCIRKSNTNLNFIPGMYSIFLRQNQNKVPGVWFKVLGGGVPLLYYDIGLTDFLGVNILNFNIFGVLKVKNGIFGGYAKISNIVCGYA